jgi:hypothetical protein
MIFTATNKNWTFKSVYILLLLLLLLLFYQSLIFFGGFDVTRHLHFCCSFNILYIF